jgi:hypothetical protein
MVWLIRILIIGSLSVRGDQVLHGRDKAREQPTARLSRQQPQPGQAFSPAPKPKPAPASRAARPIPKPKPKPIPRPENTYSIRPEPTYHTLSMRGQRKGK